MLRAIRDGSQSYLVRGLLVLIIAGFALWGVQGFGAGAPPPIAMVGDEPVPQSQFMLAFQNEVNARARQRDGEYSFQQAYDDNLDDAILDQLMFGKAFDNAATALGLHASDAQVAVALSQIPLFTDLSGNFDRVSYEEEVKRLGLTKRKFEDARRDDIERVDLINALVDGAPVPAALVDVIYKRNLEQRDVEFFEIANSSISLDAPSAEDVKRHYDANLETYTADELRKFTYVTINISDVINTIEVDEDRIVELYEDRRDTYEVAEKRDLQHLLVTDEDEANALHARLVEGLDFVEAASETGQLAAEVALGGVVEADISYLGEDAATAAFSLESGGISAPIESDLGGWVIFKTSSITPATASTLEDVRTQLRTDIAIEDAQYKIIELAEQAEDQLSEDASIEDIAESLQLKVRTVTSLNRSGFDQYGNAVQSLPPSRSFYDSVFSREPGEFAQVEETESGGYFVVRVDEVTPPALKSFDSVKNQAKAAVMSERRGQAAADRANGLLEQAIADGALGNAAGVANQNVQIGNGLRRDGQAVPAIFSRLALERLFQASVDGVFIAPNRNADGYVVAQLTNISDLVSEGGSQAYQQLKGNVRRLMANDLTTIYHTYLSADYPAETNIGVRAQLKEQLTE